MIVQCNKCQTKFRIADEKVTANGVKVRCSRCAHVFVVRRDSPTTAKVPTKSIQSFAKRTQPSQPDPPSGVPTIPPASTMAPGLPTHRASIPPAATASSLEAAAALGFSGLPAPPKNPSLPPLDVPTGLPDGLRTFTKSEALTVRSNLSDKPSAFKSSPPSAPDPFSEEATVAAGPGLDRPLPPSPFPGTDAAGFGSADLPSDDPFFDPFASPSGEETAGALPKFPGSGLPSFPDNSQSIENSADRFPAPTDFDPNDPGFQTEMNLHGLEREPPNGPASSGNFPPPPPTQNPAQGSGAFPPPGLGPNVAPAKASEIGDIPGLLPSAEEDDDPFAGVDVVDMGSGSVGAYSDLNAGGDDIGPATPAAGVGANAGPDVDALARIDLGQAGMPMHGAHHEATAVARAYAPAGARGKTGVSRVDGDGIGRWPTALGIAAGLVLAYLFVPGVQSRVAPLLGGAGVAPLGATVADTVPGSVEGVQAVGTFVRSYPTHDGRHLLVVGGQARARAAVGPLDAVVAVMDGDRVVERRTAPLGVVMDEATLKRAKAEADIEAAYLGRPPLKLEPGKSAPFMIVFWTPPGEPASKRFRVAFVNAGSSARAENAP